jgi:threonine dehydrogenase-like Zn-dependent dehydrogenase
MGGCQSELVRVPMADGSLVALTEQHDDDRVPDLLALSDVMGTGASIRARCST